MDNDSAVRAAKEKEKEAVVAKLLGANSSCARRWCRPNGSKCNRTAITTTSKAAASIVLILAESKASTLRICLLYSGS
jgi:hypothetical protein